MQTNFIIWRSNHTIDENKLDNVVAKIRESKDTKLSEGYDSTFFIPSVHDRPDVVFIEEMMNWACEGLRTMSLIDRYEQPDRLGFNIDHWCQVYHGAHLEHDHFNAASFLSWVYFARPTKQKCFYFVIDGEKVYPDQEPGDYIMFPPYALHGIDACTDTSQERVTLAGNIEWTEYYQEPNIRQTHHNVRQGLMVSEVITD